MPFFEGSRSLKVCGIGSLSLERAEGASCNLTLAFLTRPLHFRARRRQLIPWRRQLVKLCLTKVALTPTTTPELHARCRVLLHEVLVKLVHLSLRELPRLMLMGLRARLCGHCDCGLKRFKVDLQTSLGPARLRLVDKGLVKDLT